MSGGTSARDARTSKLLDHLRREVILPIGDEVAYQGSIAWPQCVCVCAKEVETVR